LSGLSRVEHVPAPVPRRLSAVKGALPHLLSSSSYDGVAGDWLQVTLTDAARPDDAMTRLTTRFPHVLVLRHEPAGAPGDGATYAARVAGRSPLEIGAAFVEHVRHTPADDGELSLLTTAIEGTRLSGAA
jgi:exonuclease SbcD